MYEFPEVPLKIQSAALGLRYVTDGREDRRRRPETLNVITEEETNQQSQSPLSSTTHAPQIRLCSQISLSDKDAFLQKKR